MFAVKRVGRMSFMADVLLSAMGCPLCPMILEPSADVQMYGMPCFLCTGRRRLLCLSSITFASAYAITVSFDSSVWFLTVTVTVAAVPCADGVDFLVSVMILVVTVSLNLNR